MPAFEARLRDFEAAGAQVVGISCDSIYSHDAWAKALGHKIFPPRPALVPLTSTERWLVDLRGVTVPDVLVRIREDNSKPLAERLRIARAGQRRTLADHTYARRIPRIAELLEARLN